MVDKRYRLDDPKTVTKIIRVFYVVCALSLLLDLVLTRKVTHSLEGIPGFYAIFGFVCCVILVIVAKWMRRFLMRDEDYYDDELTEPNELKERSDVD